MATFSTVKIQITPRGRAKLKRLREVANQALTMALMRKAERFREVAALLAPSEDEEAQLLSQGAGSTTKGVVWIGTPDGGRFFRVNGMISLREAIRSLPGTVEEKGGRIVVQVGTYSALNAVTGFSWMTKRGPDGPTWPFNRRYVQNLENGGTWYVVPRGSWWLEPEPGIGAASMVKTLPPIGMFRQAKAVIRAEAAAEITQIRETVRRALR